jgi:hypothetical protein
VPLQSHAQGCGQHKCTFMQEANDCWKWYCDTAVYDFINYIGVTPVLDKIQDYKRNWIQHVNWIPCLRLPRLINKNYTPKGRRNQGRPLKRLLDAWDRNRSTSGPTPGLLYDDTDDKLYRLQVTSKDEREHFTVIHRQGISVTIIYHFRQKLFPTA